MTLKLVRSENNAKVLCEMEVVVKDVIGFTIKFLMALTCIYPP